MMYGSSARTTKGFGSGPAAVIDRPYGGTGRSRRVERERELVVFQNRFRTVTTVMRRPRRWCIVVVRVPKRFLHVEIIFIYAYRA